MMYEIGGDIEVGILKSIAKGVTKTAKVTAKVATKAPVVQVAKVAVKAAPVAKAVVKSAAPVAKVAVKTVNKTAAVANKVNNNPLGSLALSAVPGGGQIKTALAVHSIAKNVAKGNVKGAVSSVAKLAPVKLPVNAATLKGGLNVASSLSKGNVKAAVKTAAVTAIKANMPKLPVKNPIISALAKPVVSKVAATAQAKLAVSTLAKAKLGNPAAKATISAITAAAKKGDPKAKAVASTLTKVNNVMAKKPAAAAKKPSPVASALAKKPVAKPVAKKPSPVASALAKKPIATKSAAKPSMPAPKGALAAASAARPASAPSLPPAQVAQAEQAVHASMPNLPPETVQAIAASVTPETVEALSHASSPEEAREIIAQAAQNTPQREEVAATNAIHNAMPDLPQNMVEAIAASVTPETVEALSHASSPQEAREIIAQAAQNTPQRAEVTEAAVSNAIHDAMPGIPDDVAAQVLERMPPALSDAIAHASTPEAAQQLIARHVPGAAAMMGVREDFSGPTLANSAPIAAVNQALAMAARIEQQENIAARATEPIPTARGTGPFEHTSWNIYRPTRYREGIKA